MELTINTKYNIDDTVIAYFEGEGFYKCKVIDIIPPKTFSARNDKVEPQYYCQSVDTNNGSLAQQRFNERELYTAEELMGKLTSFMDENTEAPSEAAIYAAIFNAAVVVEDERMAAFGVKFGDCLKWLSEKFPELEKKRLYGAWK